MNSEAKVLSGAPVGDFDDKSSKFACNGDALMEILLRLPTKSLIRFKLVHKQWLSLISSDQFCHLHTLRHPELQPSLILKSHIFQSWYFSPISNGINYVTPYTFTFPPRIMGSCNGLLLLQSDDPGKSFYVYNPTTKRSRKISLTDTRSTKYPHLALAFNPSKSPHYKIVCIKSTMKHFSSPFDKHTYYIEVYDSESHTWTLSLELSSKQFEISHGVYCDGSVYWDSYAKVFYFDIAEKVFKTFSRPIYPPTQNHGKIKTSTSYLQESNDHLYHSSLVSDGECEAVAVWELLLRDDDIHSPWLLKYHDVLSLPLLTVGTLNFTRQLRIIKGSHDTEACSLVFQRSEKIWVYNFLDKSLKELVDLASQPFCSKWDSFAGYEFGESLAVV